jgi:hypothetical protein
VTTSAWSLLAATPAPSPGTTSTPVATPDPDLVTPGVAGFLVVFLLAVATILLLRSMTGHLRKVRYSPDPAAEDAEPRADRPDRPEQQQKPEKPEKPATNGAERP